MKKGNDKSIMFNTHLDSRSALYSLLTLVKCENCSIHQKFTNEIVWKFVGANLFMKMKQQTTYLRTRGTRGTRNLRIEQNVSFKGAIWIYTDEMQMILHS